MVKERIDVEQLLIWSYRTQEVDRRCAAKALAVGGGAGSNWPGQTLELGARVDISGAGAWMASVALAQARTADDALAVHDAVLALDDMWLACDASDATLWTRESARGEGFEIAGERDAWSLRPAVTRGCGVEPAPVALARVVVAPLLILHARAGTRPDWCEGWDAAAAEACGRDRWGRRRVRPRGANAVEAVVRDRAVYLVWRAALACLAVSLEDALDGWLVEGPHAPEAPWEMRARRTLDSLTVQSASSVNGLKI